MMKKLVFALLTICSLIASCNPKEEVNPSAETKLTYEVITTSGKWFGEFFDKEGNRTVISTEQSSGWKYDFTIKDKQFEMFVNATSSCICFGTSTSPDVTINFYVNGVKVKSETNNWAKGVTSLTYNIK